jgi:hypothetical protein
MKREAAVKEFDDTMWRKYLLDNKTLRVLRNPITEEKDTHAALAVGLGLNPKKVKGGFLQVEKSKFKHVKSSSTVPTGSQADLDNFGGEVEIF